MTDSQVIAMKPQIELRISLDTQTGSVQVNGPIHDRILCLGLLELAKEALASEAKRQASQILVARPAVRM